VETLRTAMTHAVTELVKSRTIFPWSSGFTLMQGYGRGVRNTHLGKEEPMSHYHDTDDLKVLGEFKKLAPAEFKGFVELDAIVGRDDGKIPRKYRELIALAVACTTQCPYCLDVHTRNAKQAGATREEVTEAAFLAAALRAGAAVTHGALALKLFDRA